MSSGFGFSGTATDFAAPVDDRTTDVTTGVEWANQKGLVAVNYDGSWYNQNIPSLTWDNPVAFTNSASVPSQGRLALWPSNNANTLRVNGSLKLPYHSKASAALSVRPLVAEPVAAAQHDQPAPGLTDRALVGRSTG